MSSVFKSAPIGLSVLSLAALAATPAQAASLTNPTMSGGEYLIYEQVDADSTALNPHANPVDVLAGDVNNPGGNIELSGQRGNANAKSMMQSTQLSGMLGGQNILIESLTLSDWLFTPYQGYGSLAQKWITDAWQSSESGFAQYLVDNYLPSGYDVSYDITTLSNQEWGGLVRNLAMGGLFNRFSDPNVSYVNMEANNVFVGLAGHLNHPSGVKMSEVVKVTFGDDTHYLYDVGAAQASGLRNDVGEGADGTSHDGIYNLSFQTASSTADVPEPSTMLGLFAVGGLCGLRKRQNRDNA